MRYEMIGKQPIRLSGGRVIEPNAGVFEATLDPKEAERFVRFGCIRVVDVDKSAGQEKVVAEEVERTHDDLPPRRKRGS